MNNYIVEIDEDGIKHEGINDTFYDHVTIKIFVEATSSEDAEFAVRNAFNIGRLRVFAYLADDEQEDNE